MNNLTFIDSALMSAVCGYEVSVLPPGMGMWDRQTLVILYSSDEAKKYIRDSIRRAYKPSSHSEGSGYEIDIYTNLNYSRNETNPAMRNVRAVYCNENILTQKALNDRFPNSYIIRVMKKEERKISYDTRIDGREIPQVPCDGGCPQEIRRGNSTSCIR